MVNFVFLNWASTSSISSKLQEAQARALAATLHKGKYNVGLVVMPMWSHKKGQLFRLEALILEKLASLGLNVDQKFSITFQERSDQRDDRQLSAGCRVVTSAPHVNHLEDGKGVNPWRKTPGWPGRRYTAGDGDKDSRHAGDRGPQ